MLQDSIGALARDSARAMLQRDGVDLRYFAEAWFFVGIAISILAWCWRTWREVHGAGVRAARLAGAAASADASSADAPAGAPAGAPTDASADAPDGALDDAAGPVRLRCPACERVVGDTRAPLGYLTVCPACGRPISVRLEFGRPRVVLRAE